MKTYPAAIEAMERKDYDSLAKLAQGVGREEPDEKGWTAYSYAAYMKDEQALAVLERCGADKGCWQDALLHRGVYDGDAETVRIAVQKGANVNALYASNSMIEQAASFGYPEVVQSLVELGSVVPPDILFKVCHWELADWKVGSEEDVRRYADVVRILIDAGADPELRVEGRTPAEAIAGDNLVAIKEELKKGRQNK